MAQLVTVRSYRDLSEAIVARSLLESCGIVVYLYDENLVRLNWQISNFIGGIRLQVEVQSEFEARAILEAPAPDVIAYEEDAVSYAQPTCPQCGSVQITFKGSSRKAALALLYLFSLPFPHGTKTWSCSNCGHRWVATKGSVD